MRHKDDKDLFEESTMTFGEHLEELRICLFKSLAGLIVGFIIGLFFGGYVVDFIQTPLNEALSEYYKQQSREQLKAQIAELRKAGYPMPEDHAEAEKLVDEWINKKGLTFEEVYVNPTELLTALRKADPERFANLPAAKPQAGDDESTSDPFVKIFIGHPTASDPRVRSKSLNAHEAFVIYIKASLLVGLVISSPWIFLQIWNFVAAGLYIHERRFVHIFLPASLLLFIAGACTAFFFVFQPVLDFLFSFNRSLGIDPDPRISEWLSFVLMLPVGFGISFQLPLVMLFLERIGIFDVEAYLSKWRIAVLVIFVVSMFLTPADPYSMLLMAVPLTLLYGGGILLCKWFPRKRSPYDEIDD